MDFLVYRSYQRRFGKTAEKSVGIVRLENCKPLVCLKEQASGFSQCSALASAGRSRSSGALRRVQLLRYQN